MLILKMIKKSFICLVGFVCVLIMIQTLACTTAKKPKVKKSKQKKVTLKKPKVIFREGTEPKVGSVAPVIIAPTIKNKVVDTSNCEGKVIVLNFWSIRCGPCIKEMPYLERLYDEFKERGLEIISINTDQASLKKVSAFIEEKPFSLSYNIVTDPDLILTTVFTKWFVPVTIIIDSKGVMRYNNTGFTKRDYEKYRKIIKNLLKESKK
ncbi:TlpA disulfide reductase family protein [Thermodesulfobacteriota bacterium]